MVEKKLHLANERSIHQVPQIIGKQCEELLTCI